jgi:hypothetical protein
MSHLHSPHAVSINCLKLPCWYIYLLISRSRVLLEKLTGSQLVKKFPAFYRAQRFITAFTKAHALLAYAQEMWFQYMLDNEEYSSFRRIHCCVCTFPYSQSHVIIHPLLAPLFPTSTEQLYLWRWWE